MDNAGNFLNFFVELSVDYRKVGTTGLKKVIRVVNNKNKNVTMLRRSFSFDVPEGVYEIRVTRITEERNDAGKVSDIFTWAGARGNIVYDTNSKVYGDTHMLAMRIKANDVVSQQASKQIHVGAFRKLERFDNGFGRTSNPADHMRDIITNQLYGGRRPADEVDTTLLHKLHKHWGGNLTSTGFNGIFNGKSIMFDALKTVLQPVASLPLPIGASISVKYDGVKPIRTQVFNENNIQLDSFQISYNFDNADRFDGYQIEYRNGETWQREFEIYPPTSLHSRSIQLFGCTNKVLAQQMARYLWQRDTYNRKTLTFKTELDGLIPRSGDRIGVQHTLADWGVGGSVVNYNSSTRELTLDRDVIFTTGDHYVMLRNENGSAGSIVKVTHVSDNVVILDKAIAQHIFNTVDPSPTLYFFGYGDTYIKDFIVNSISHEGDITATLHCTAYDERSFDSVMPYLKQAVT